MLRKNLALAVFSLIGTLSVNTETFAKAAYMVSTGATNCAQCHADNYGNGYKDGMLNATSSVLGKFEGLKGWLKTVGTDTKPVLHDINDEWDAMVGEELMIQLHYSDAEDDSFTLIGTVPKGVTAISPSVDAETHTPVVGVRWTPTADQANKTFTLTLGAKEAGVARGLLSEQVDSGSDVKVRVWAARTSATKNVSRLMVRRAQWLNNKLFLEGKVVFQPTVTAAQRTAALNSLLMSVKTEAGVAVGTSAKLTADANGNWATTISSLTSTKVPCVVKLDYEGLIATRTVKLAPAATCLK